jgi:hypothetical protein
LTGGSSSHSHVVNAHNHTITTPIMSTSTDGSHTHSFSVNKILDRDGVKEGTGFVHNFVENESVTIAGTTFTAGGHSHTIGATSFNSSSASPGTNSQSHLPPYYKLAFIMKL